MNKVLWVVVGPEPYLATCERCGKHEPKPEFPTTVGAFIAYFKYVMEKHRYCQEPQGDGTTTIKEVPR
jgi:hypothetical protein